MIILDSDSSKTPSSFDRSIDPPYGKAPTLNVPTDWKIADPNLSEGFYTFVFQPNTSPASVAAGDALVFTLNNIEIICKFRVVVK